MTIKKREFDRNFSGSADVSSVGWAVVPVNDSESEVTGVISDSVRSSAERAFDISGSGILKGRKRNGKKEKETFGSNLF